MLVPSRPDVRAPIGATLRLVKSWARLLVLAIPVGIVGLAVYGYWEGTPLDLVIAVRNNDIASVKASIARDPQAVHTKVFPQAFERVSQQAAHRATSGEDPWQGRYIIHDALALIDPIPMLELLVAAGADPSVRLQGRTLLHMAAYKGDDVVVSWLLERGADVNATNTCEDCAERGQTPLFDAQNFNDRELTPMLIARGADPHARALNGQTALHASAVVGSVAGAFELCRHGTNPTVKDAEGRTARDLALAADAAGRDLVRRTLLYGPGEQADWLKPGGGCETLAARAAAAGSPVSEEEASAVFRVYACARGEANACRGQ